MRIVFLGMIIAVLGLSQASANDVLTYNKAKIRIVPASDGVQPVIKGNDKKAVDTRSGELIPNLQRVGKEFAVEVRTLAFLEQRDFVVHQPFSDKEGMMIPLEIPATITLQSSSLFGKTDILFVLEDGLIDSIAPEISLRDLTEPLASNKPVRAVIFLKSGMVRSSDIRPGDRVVADIFKHHPVILQ